MTAGETFSRRSLFIRLRQMLRGAVEDPVWEARVLTEEAAGLAPGSFLGEEPVEGLRAQQALEQAGRRCEGYPLQYLIGHWPFRDLEFTVAPGVLIPRQDTETVCDAALRLIENVKEPVVYDLCAGSGCIGCSIAHERPDASVYAVEKSEEALPILRANVRELTPQVTVVQDDVLTPVCTLPPADLIVSNPPYLTKEDMQRRQREVTFEPELALDGGKDGLLFYRLMPAVWRERLQEGGALVFEIGMGQEEAVKTFLSQAGFSGIGTERDLCGVVRAVWGRIVKKDKK